MIHNDTPKDQTIGELQSAIADMGEGERKGPLNLRRLCVSRVAFHIPKNVSLGF